MTARSITRLGKALQQPLFTILKATARAWARIWSSSQEMQQLALMAELGAQISHQLQKMQAYISYPGMLGPRLGPGSLYKLKEKCCNTFVTEEVEEKKSQCATPLSLAELQSRVDYS